MNLQPYNSNYKIKEKWEQLRVEIKGWGGWKLVIRQSETVDWIQTTKDQSSTDKEQEWLKQFVWQTSNAEGQNKGIYKNLYSVDQLITILPVPIIRINI